MAEDSSTVVGDSATLLEELGLTEYEAYCFVYLLQLGSGTAKDVAELDHVPRTRVYDAMDTLHEAGLVDIQYTSPRKYTPVSRETALRRLNLERETTIDELGSLLDDLEPADRAQEELGVWTAQGDPAVKSRVLEFIEEADSEIIYMTVDPLLTEDHLEALAAAADRGVTIYLGGLSPDTQTTLTDRIPDAEHVETLWAFSEEGAGSLLVTDQETALVSVIRPTNEHEEELAVWGTGNRNALVIVLRTIFTWQLGTPDPDTG